MRTAQIQNGASQLSYHANMQVPLDRTKIYAVMEKTLNSYGVHTTLVKLAVQEFEPS